MHKPCLEYKSDWASDRKVGLFLSGFDVLVALTPLRTTYREYEDSLRRFKSIRPSSVIERTVVPLCQALEDHKSFFFFFFTEGSFETLDMKLHELNQKKYTSYVNNYVDFPS